MIQEKHRFLLIAIFAIILILQTTAQNVFNVPQYHPCPGDEIIMSCYIDNQGFDSLVYVSFNGSQPFSPTEINEGRTPDFDFFTVEVAKIDNTSPFQNALTINITFYEEEDSYILFGCHGKFLINNTMSDALASGQLLSQASPPEGLRYVVSLRDSFDTASCRLRTDFIITKPQSGKPILHYQLYSNGEYVSYLHEKSNGDLVVSVQLQPGISNELQVSAVSCGGESVLSDPITESIRGYTLDTSSLNFYLNSDNMLSLYWTLTPLGEGTNEVNIEYSLQLFIKYTTDTVTHNSLNQSTIINVISSEQSYAYDLGISELGDSKISLDITASLKIVSLCSFDVTDGAVATFSRKGLNSTVEFLTSHLERNLLIAASVLFVTCALSSACQSLYILIICNNKSKKKRLHGANYAPLPMANLDNNNAGRSPTPDAPPLPMGTTGTAVHPFQMQANTWSQ